MKDKDLAEIVLADTDVFMELYREIDVYGIPLFARMVVFNLEPELEYDPTLPPVGKDVRSRSAAQALVKAFLKGYATYFYLITRRGDEPWMAEDPTSWECPEKYAEKVISAAKEEVNDFSNFRHRVLLEKAAAGHRLCNIPDLHLMSLMSGFVMRRGMRKGYFERRLKL